MLEHVRLAARNNGLWCLAVCHAHGCRTSLEDGYWACANPPRFYSNLVTLRPGLEPLVAATRPAGLKDSFCDIAGALMGYRELFAAHWIWREPAPASPTSLDWRQVANDAELLAWEAGWASGDPDATLAPRQFPSSLLEDPEIAFLSGFRDGVLTAGFAANFSDHVLGISNTFTLGGCEEAMWSDLPHAAALHWPDVPLVGYERGASLNLAKAVGFQTTGQLRVWVRD